VRITGWYVVGGRWGSAGFGSQEEKSRFQVSGSSFQGLNEDSGVRIHESEVRGRNEEHLLPARRFPPSAS
jgi:hypothetical protein